MEPPSNGAAGGRTAGPIEWLALLLLLVGGLVSPVVLWLAGAVLLWCSRVWTVRAKVLGTVVWPGGACVWLLVFFALPLNRGAGACWTRHVPGERVVRHCATVSPGLSGPPKAAWLAIAVLFVAAPLAVAGYLALRARRGGRLSAPGPSTAPGATGTPSRGAR